VPISAFTATDNIGVTGYMITESAAAPSSGAAGWSATAPTSFTFSAAGTKTAYAWAKDAAGNVSAAKSAAVTITLPVAAPVIASAPGSASHGQSITIGGSGFGTKSQAAPALFDEVSNTWSGLANGQAIPQNTQPWNSLNVSAYDSTPAEQRSARSTANYHQSNNVKNMVQGFQFPTTPTRAQKIYMSWWFNTSLPATAWTGTSAKNTSASPTASTSMAEISPTSS
jgi:hypothetical protein